MGKYDYEIPELKLGTLTLTDIPTKAKKTKVLKPKNGKVYYEGKVYIAKLDELMGDTFLGGRLTDCCESFSTIDDGPLYCKKCYRTVEWGEGDGSEKLDADWKLNAKKDSVVSCKVEDEVATKVSKSKGVKITGKIKNDSVTVKLKGNATLTYTKKDGIPEAFKDLVISKN